MLSPDEVLAAQFDCVDQTDLDRELIFRLGLYEFVKRAWPLVGAGAPFVPGWHLEQICKHLEAVTRGEIHRLLINIPPGCSKSTIVSVLWPAWDWIACPTRKWIVASGSDKLMRRDADAHRFLVASPWYSERWREKVELSAESYTRNTQAIFSNTAGGRRLSVTVGGNQVLGWHGDRHIVDDPNDPEAIARDPALAKKELERTWSWWTNTMAGRVVNPKTFARVVIMQRLGENDLVGRILETERERWTVLIFPMRFEPERACVTAWGGDIRSEPGELLCPGRFDEQAVRERERDMGSQTAAAQLQQRPAPAAGAIFKRDWFSERWETLPEIFTFVISADCSFKDTPGADFVAIHIWGLGKGKFYLVDRLHDRMGLPETVRAILALAKRWPQARAKLIEDKANGPAVEQVLRDKLAGMIMMEPKTMGGSKVARANAVAPLCEARNVVLPASNAKHSVGLNGSKTLLTYEWVDDFLEELCTFPFARHDDDVDAATQALIYLHDHNPTKYIDAMNRVKSGETQWFR